jgi:hypothetical protein
MSDHDSKIQELGRKRQRLVEQLRALDAELDPHIQAAAQGGTPQVDVIKWTGLARESVRLKSMTDEERDAVRKARTAKARQARGRA